MTPCYDPERKLENIIIYKNLETKKNANSRQEGVYIFDSKLKII
jgi:hypothetical protein